METLQTEAKIEYCQVHPTVETTLHCNRCGRPMCMKCAVHTPVGYRCQECVRGQQNVFFNAKSSDPVLQIAVSIGLGAVGSALIGLLPFGFLFGIILGIMLGGAAGGFIADTAHRVVSKRRGRYSHMYVGAGIVAGALLTLLFFSLTIPKIVFVVAAVAGAAGRLRLGR